MKIASTSSQGKAAATWIPEPQPLPMGGMVGPLPQPAPSGPAQAVSMMPGQAATPGSVPWADGTPQSLGLVAEVDEYDGQNWARAGATAPRMSTRASAARLTAAPRGRRARGARWRSCAG